MMNRDEMNMIQLARFTSVVSETLMTIADGEYVLYADVAPLISNIEKRHKLAMDKLQKFNTMGTISGRLVSSPGSVRRMTEEQIIEQERGRSYMRQVIDKSVSDKVKFAADVAKVAHYRHVLRRYKSLMGKLQSDTVQFEELEL